MAWLPAVCEKESNTNDLGLDWEFGTHIYMASMAGMYTTQTVFSASSVKCTLHWLPGFKANALPTKP